MAWELERVATHQDGCGSAAVCLVLMQVRAPTSNLSRPLRSQHVEPGPMIAQIVLRGSWAWVLVAWELEGGQHQKMRLLRFLSRFHASPWLPPQICPDPCAICSKSLATGLCNLSSVAARHGPSWLESEGGGRGGQECSLRGVLCFSHFSSSYLEARDSCCLGWGGKAVDVLYFRAPQPLQTVSLRNLNDIMTMHTANDDAFLQKRNIADHIAQDRWKTEDNEQRG